MLSFKWIYFKLHNFQTKYYFLIFIYKFENTILITIDPKFCSCIFVYNIISKIKYINKFKLNNNQKNSKR